MRNVLEVVGLGCLVAACACVSITLGLAALGAALILVSYVVGR